MPYVITEPCIDVMDASCVSVCPVDCIHTAQGAKQYYIDPAGCIDCAACEAACPVTAIFHEDDVPSEWASYVQSAQAFFRDALVS